MIESLWLVHHSHTDLGYTDLPSTTWDLHIEYITQAIELCERTASYPESARFRWNCEVLWPVQRFLRQATPEWRQRFDRAFERGQIDLGAMPFNISAIVDAAEWRELVRDLDELYRRYRPVVAMQNDINGMPWGIIPSWRELGVRSFWTGPNMYSAGPNPTERPSWWWWQGAAEDQRVLVHLAAGYNTGYFFFHPKEWRRGPVPSAADVWFHPPAGDDIFASDPASLSAAHAQCVQKLSELPKDYPFNFLPLSVTNMWRFDNDPPLAALSDFVAAWNQAGLQPHLRLATMREVDAQAQLQAASSPLQTLRGDWPDWWADYLAPSPSEVAACQAARRRLVDVPAAAKLLGSDLAAVQPKLDDAWRDVSLFCEHTFGSFNSVPQPYGWLTLGHAAETVLPAYRAEELSRLAMTAVMRSSPAYARFASTRWLDVFNPSQHARSGWIAIPARAMRQSATAVRDVVTGQILPLESFGQEPYWGTPKSEAPRPFEVPDNVWPFRTAHMRFHVSSLPGQSRRQFELVDVPVEPPAIQELDRAICPGLLASGAHALGDVIFDVHPDFDAREQLLTRRPTQVDRQVARCVESQAVPTHYGQALVRRLEHPHCHGIEQRLHRFASDNQLELITTLWLKEMVVPQAIYLAIPLAGANPTVWYDSMGQPTRVGDDQFTRACGEMVAVGPGVQIETGPGGIGACVLATPDTLLCCFDAPSARTGKLTAKPKTAAIYPLIHHNYWATNVPITKAAKLVLRHVLAWGPSLHSLPSAAALAGELFGVPVGAPKLV